MTAWNVFLIIKRGSTLIPCTLSLHQKKKNIRLGLVLDGVNPFSNQSLSHSTWVVMFLNYSLPPWLVTKKFFVMLSLIIPRKESVTAENIDVYLSLLIEELLELWDGVEATDVSANSGNQKFTLKAMLMWCIHDFPAYRLASGQVTKGYKGCPECGPNVTTRRSAALGKNICLGHRRYLNRSHPYRRLKRPFDGNEELRAPPRPITGRDIIRYATVRNTWLAASLHNRPGTEHDPVHHTGVKRLSAFYRLPYWQVHLIVPVAATLQFWTALRCREYYVVGMCPYMTTMTGKMSCSVK